jgi:hypothetical protein
MGYDVSAYVEKKNKETGKWDLVTPQAVSARLKYIFDDYNKFPQVKWDDLSDGMKGMYKQEKDDTTGEARCYTNFYVTTLQELEDKTSDKINDCFTRLNMVVKALGCERVFSDEGDELEPWGDDEKKDKLTFPINKQLIEDLQYGYETMRQIGQREAFDLFISEYIHYDGEYRIIFTVS